jgi:hypothetical protein
MNRKMRIRLTEGNKPNVGLIERWVQRKGEWTNIVMDLVNDRVYINGEETEDTKNLEGVPNNV